MAEVSLRGTRGQILLSLMLGTFLIAIDSTILATAVPTIVGELGGFSQFPWLFSIYLLGQAASVPVYAKLCDTFGRKPVMLFGIGLFLAGSILSATAWSMTVLIIFRAIQGLGAGAIMPSSMTIAGDIYTVRERATAQAYLASVWAISAVAGPTLGGVFAQFFSWRWIFWVNVPMGLLAAFMLIRSYHESFERTKQRIDITGATLLTTALVLLVLGVLEGGQGWTWGSWQSVGCFAVGAALLVAFAVVERRAADPVLAPWVTRDRVVVTTSLASLGVGAVTIGLTSFVPTFLEQTAGAVPLLAGLAVAAQSIGWPISGSLAGRFYLRIGFRATMVIGSTMTLIGAVALTLFSFTPSVWLTAAGCIAVGLGLGLVANPALIAAQSSVGLRERGVVSGTNTLARAVGSAVGVAVYGAIANAVIAARGGQGHPAAIQAGSTAVFVSVAVSAALLIACTVFVPRVPISDE
jgi:EmrB/QacA subfamily drug resistance transporter